MARVVASAISGWSVPLQRQAFGAESAAPAALLGGAALILASPVRTGSTVATLRRGPEPLSRGLTPRPLQWDSVSNARRRGT